MWWNSLTGEQQTWIIAIPCLILLAVAMLWYLNGSNTCYHEDEIETGYITRNGERVAYYRIIKRHFLNGRTKVVTERTELP